MIVKPSIQFLNYDSDPQLIVSTDGILAGMTGNASYLTPAPTLAAVGTAKDEFATALSDAAGGGVALTAVKNAKRAALVALLRQLASYVQVQCGGNLAVLLSSGFPIQKPQRQSIGVLPAPEGLVVTLGNRTGELSASVTPVTGAAIYNWRVSLASTPDVVVQSAQTTAASNTFTGLTPGMVYTTEVNVVGSAGPSNWSGPVPQMVV